MTVEAAVPAATTGTGSGSGSGAGGASSGATDLKVSDVKLDGPKLTLHLACGKTARCAGDVADTVGRLKVADGQWTATTVTIGRSSFDLREGAATTKTVTLNAAGRRALAAAGTHLTALVQTTRGRVTAATEVWHRSVTLHPDKPARNR